MRASWPFLMLLLLSIAACSSREDHPGGADAGLDAGARDAGERDARVPDGGSTDAASVDAALTDAASGEDGGPGPDAGRDAGQADAGRDAGSPDGGRDAGATLCDLSACTPTCFRPYDCAPACGEPAESCGCCPCIAGAVDTISCP